MTAEARSLLDQYVLDHPRGKKGRVINNLKRDFDAAPAELRERFRFYFDRCPVRVESGISG